MYLGENKLIYHIKALIQTRLNIPLLVQDLILGNEDPVLCENGRKLRYYGIISSSILRLKDTRPPDGVGKRDGDMQIFVKDMIGY